MNHKRVEQLLRDYARLNPPKRLLSPETAARLRAELAPERSEGGKGRFVAGGFRAERPGRATRSITPAAGVDLVCVGGRGWVSSRDTAGRRLR